MSRKNYHNFNLQNIQEIQIVINKIPKLTCNKKEKNMLKNIVHKVEKNRDRRYLKQQL